MTLTLRRADAVLNQLRQLKSTLLMGAVPTDDTEAMLVSTVTLMETVVQRRARAIHAENREAVENEQAQGRQVNHLRSEQGAGSRVAGAVRD